MESPSVVVKIAAVGSVKLVQPVDGVFRSMTVHNVQEHHNTKTVCRVDQLLQIFGCTVSTEITLLIGYKIQLITKGIVVPGRSKETRHLVAETCVVGVLHDCHQLNGIVT